MRLLRTTVAVLTAAVLLCGGVLTSSAVTNRARGTLLPDLVVKGVTTAASADLGGTLFVHDVTANAGTKTAGATETRYGLALSPTAGTTTKLLGGRDVPSLLPGKSSAGTVEVGIPASVAPGNYFVVACADSTRRVYESHETNNCRTDPTKVTLTRPNQRPHADFTFSPGAPVTGQTVTFTSTSTDPDGTIVKSEWDFGSSPGFTDASGTSVTHTFTTAGTYTVRLRVTDNRGGQDIDSKTVAITAPRPPADVPPQASFTYSPSDPVVGEQVQFTSDSTDSDGTIAKTEWDFGSSPGFSDASGTSVAHTFDAAGTYTVRVRVTDNGGATDIDSHQVVVSPPPDVPPRASFTYSSPEPHVNCESVTFNSDSTDSDGTIVNYEWDFGSGGFTYSSTGSTAGSCFLAGTYTVRLRVTDDGGKTDIASHQLVIPPAESLEGGNVADAILVDSSDPNAIDDAACGIMSTILWHPCKTISYGLARAVSTARHGVYLTTGIYPEAVNLVNGISIYGGYEALNMWQWVRIPGLTVITGVTSIGNSIAAVIGNNITSATTLRSLEIVTPSATATGGTAYGIKLSNASANLTLDSITVVGGGGAPGANGSTGADGRDGPAGTAGSPGACAGTGGGQGGAGGALVAAGGNTVSGGSGGSGGSNGFNGSDGTGVAGGDGNAGSGAGGGAKGTGGAGGISSSNRGADGTAGGNGANGTNGAAAIGVGSVIGGLWVGSSSGNGANGSNGGGGGAGGGGYGSTGNRGDGGGGGGAGGELGTGGGGGAPGGASIALFIVGGTAPVVENSTFFLGVGGSGGFGGVGGRGGRGGRGAVGATACPGSVGLGGNGGDGGSGGNGGHGGGGAGGASYGIYTSGIGTPNYGQAAANNTYSGGAGGMGGSSLGNPGVTGAHSLYSFN